MIIASRRSVGEQEETIRKGIGAILRISPEKGYSHTTWREYPPSVELSFGSDDFEVRTTLYTIIVSEEQVMMFSSVSLQKRALQHSLAPVARCNALYRKYMTPC